MDELEFQNMYKISEEQIYNLHGFLKTPLWKWSNIYPKIFECVRFDHKRTYVTNCEYDIGGRKRHIAASNMVYRKHKSKGMKPGYALEYTCGDGWEITLVAYRDADGTKGDRTTYVVEKQESDGRSRTRGSYLRTSDPVKAYNYIYDLDLTNKILPDYFEYVNAGTRKPNLVGQISGIQKSKNHNIDTSEKLPDIVTSCIKESNCVITERSDRVDEGCASEHGIVAVSTKKRKRMNSTPRNSIHPMVTRGKLKIGLGGCLKQLNLCYCLK